MQRLPVDDAALAGIGPAQQKVPRQLKDLSVRDVRVVEPHQAPNLCGLGKRERGMLVMAINQHTERALIIRTSTLALRSGLVRAMSLSSTAAAWPLPCFSTAKSERDRVGSMLATQAHAF